jgi:hypothetical protein
MFRPGTWSILDRARQRHRWVSSIENGWGSPASPEKNLPARLAGIYATLVWTGGFEPCARVRDGIQGRYLPQNDRRWRGILRGLRDRISVHDNAAIRRAGLYDRAGFRGDLDRREKRARVQSDRVVRFRRLQCRAGGHVLSGLSRSQLVLSAAPAAADLAAWIPRLLSRLCRLVRGRHDALSLGRIGWLSPARPAADADGRAGSCGQRFHSRSDLSPRR